MKTTSRLAAFSFLFLALLSASLSMNVPKALAKANVVHSSSLSPKLELALTFQPKIGDVLLPVKFSFDQNGNISVAATAWAIDTPLGLVSLDANLSVPLLPQISPQAQQAFMSADSLLLIVRHRQGTVLEDSNYQIQTNQNIQGIDVKGTISEVSIRYTGTHFIVFIDASSGNINSISLQGVSTGTITTAKTGCPNPTLLAWSMNLSQSNIQRDTSSPCKFQLTNLGANGADGQCPVGLGSFDVQLTFPWWHFWDSNETHTCDGKTSSTIDDMAVADSASIAFNFSTKPTDSTTTTSTISQTCMVISADGLYGRVAPTSQSAQMAQYSSGESITYVQVVNGETVEDNSHWGQTEQGYYFWMGATDHPNG